MRGIKNPRIQKAMSYVWFIGFIAWLFMAIGVAFFKYDPGLFIRAVTFLLGAAFFYQQYDLMNGGEHS